MKNVKSSKKGMSDGYGSAAGPQAKNSVSFKSGSSGGGGNSMGEVGFAGSMRNVVSGNTGAAGSVSLRKGKSK